MSDDRRLREVTAAWPVLSPEDRELVADLVRRLTGHQAERPSTPRARLRTDVHTDGED